tara:strand:- start:293 stop:460 length:168 start_codon:yes stop_codon:yes gene_type:complete
MAKLNKKTFEKLSVKDDSLINHSLYNCPRVNSIIVKQTNQGFITSKVIYKNSPED